jgi:hypothetical protein
MSKELHYICNMINPKDDKANFPGIAVLIMLFFLIISTPSDSAVTHLNDSPKSELVTEFHSSPMSADILLVINIPAFQKNWVTTHDKLGFMVYDRTLKICDDNRTTKLRLNTLQKEEFALKEIVFYRFYYPMFSLVSTELPSLS